MRNREPTGMFTFADKPETVIAHTSQEVTETSLFLASFQIFAPHT